MRQPVIKEHRTPDAFGVARRRAGGNRWLLLPPLLLPLVALAIILTAGTASAGHGSETRVGAIPTAALDAVAVDSVEAPGQVGCLRPSQPGLVSGSCVATNNVPGGGGTARAKNHLQPDPDATGPHTTFRRDADTGQVNHYAEWIPNPHNPSGWELTRRFDLTGKPHFNKATQEWLPTPHVQGPSIPGGVRSADPWEVPK